ncbi:ubiquinone biosynthesis regulatory protein kinase UbiB [Halioglobus sp. HI00S01]|uniref:ubiquinone biosynthesis regulatory protein kinase UbiB n=1 Tax=Halioglobus sp. HI00S01 TaxID=1822214 RepID=UPI0007C2B615|nr:ubiquinone biosynthesis regulatory protein kinase UbiB [Halioglobus sp. HI00S01]KZX56081.1 ubiquinone biosynthesis regulatory protein kinase UbiB [Halioglobus sp. HI00S01]
MSRVLRLTKIIRTVGRYRLDELIDTERLPRALRWGLKLSPWRLTPSPAMSRGERLRKALEELGPVFIKFGQMLSTRRDLLPEDIADELARLQDNVPPFPQEQSLAIIESALGSSIDTLYASFEAAPMASASVAQVHAATLHRGEEVVVKVVRPDIEPVIRQDIALLYTLARLVERHVPDGRRLRPVEVVNDYELVILDELDLGREAANASQLRRNFEGSNLVYVPKVYWDYSCRDVFTMERISGIPVTDMAALRERGVDLKVLAERGVEIFFTQVLRDSFFHADMHPGNIFVDATDPADPSYIAVDCAIIGALSESDQYYLARNLLAIFRRDYHEVAQLHVECGWVPPHTRVQDFESAMRAVCEPIFERPISEISFGELLIYLFRTARRFDMEVQPSLVLLQKTLLNIEGLGRQLYPELNLWDTAMPFLEEWVAQRYSPQSVIRRLQRHAPSWLEQLPQLPDVVMDNLQHTRELEQRFDAQQQHVQQIQQAAHKSVQRQRRYIVAGLAVGAAALMAVPSAWDQLLQAPLATWLLAALGLALLWPQES